jgi:hypothetical protein
MLQPETEADQRNCDLICRALVLDFAKGEPREALVTRRRQNATRPRQPIMERSFAQPKAALIPPPEKRGLSAWA